MDAKQEEVFIEAEALVLELQERAIDGKINPEALLLGCTQLGIKTMVMFDMSDEEIVDCLALTIKREREQHEEFLKRKENEQ